MDFLDHIGALCAIRYFEFDGKRVEVVRAESNPVPPEKPGAAWDVSWNVVYHDIRPNNGAERCAPLARFLEHKPRPVPPDDFETYLAQHNLLLMVRDLPPLLGSFSDPEGVAALREDCYDGRIPVDEACNGTRTQIFDAAEEWDALLGIRRVTKSEVFNETLKQLALPPALAGIVATFDPGKEAAPLPNHSSAVGRTRQ